jgi:hypothetical protein
VITSIWKESRQPLSWRHGVLFLYWVLTIIPAIMCMLFESCGGFLDVTYGKVRRWANPKAYVSRDLLHYDLDYNKWPNEGFNIRDYLNADRDSITQPFPYDMLREPPTR